MRLGTMLAAAAAGVALALAPGASSGRCAASAEIAPKPLCTRGAVLLCLVNYARKANGVAPVSGSDRLHAAAALKAQRIVECWPTTNLSHAPCNDDPFLVFAQAGWAQPGSCWCGENIAWGYAGQRAVMAAWLASPGHRANILSPAYTNVGHNSHLYVGGGRLWTEDFGHRG